MKMEKSWRKLLDKEIARPYMEELKAFLAEEKKQGKIIYPPENQVFQAFLETPFDQVKVVIVGQDPYHGPNQAHGLSFSVLPEQKKLPPSLKNIFKELSRDLNISISSSGYLNSWAKQGVFLLNATLTVCQGEPRSHFGKGWETFTDAVIDLLAEKKDPIVFLLWGKSAQDKGSKIALKENGHLILSAPHPSPYSASSGFFGCSHFSKANAFLESVGKTPIDWKLS